MLIEAASCYLMPEDFKELGTLPLDKQITMIRAVADVFDKSEAIKLEANKALLTEFKGLNDKTLLQELELQWPKLHPLAQAMVLKIFLLASYQTSATFQELLLQRICLD